MNLAKFLLVVLLFHPNHSNIFAAYGNDLPIKTLFCRKDVFRGVSHMLRPCQSGVQGDGSAYEKQISFLHTDEKNFLC